MSLCADRTEEILQIHKLRRTPGRIALLKYLAVVTGPVSIEHLQSKFSHDLDLASVYRALDAFTKEGLVARFDFGHGHAHYELAHEKPHHHHAICESCGRIDDIPAQDSPQLTSLALKSAPRFSRLTRHSLEFYGLCTACA